MTVSVTHSIVATLPDEPGAEVNKAEWNAAHVMVHGPDDNYVTAAQLSVLANTSGANTGDASGHAALAPLASPTFTGTVTLPTPFTLGAVSVTPTGAELNFVDGVTSSIQTQLNAKASALGADDNYVTDAEKIVIGNTSGTNTGDNTNFAAPLGSDDNYVTDAQLVVIGNTSGTNTGDASGHTGLVPNTGDSTLAGVKTFSSAPLIPDEAYGVGWNASLEPPTKNALFDKIETLGAGGGVDTANSPAAGEFARFTDADTIEGRTVAETKSDLGLGTMAEQAASAVAITGGTVVVPQITLGTSGILVGGTNAVEQRNGTSPQVFRFYNTYTNASNYERGELEWSGDTFGINVRAAGSGTLRTMRFSTQAGGAFDFSHAGVGIRWILNSDGHFIAGSDNTYDLGLSGANRPRTGYFATSVIAPTITATTRVNHKSYTVATLPAAGVAGGEIYVSDETGGAILAFSDGAAWRRHSDRAVVS